MRHKLNICDLPSLIPEDFPIFLEPFYTNFHDCLEKLLQSEEQTTSEDLDSGGSNEKKTKPFHGHAMSKIIEQLEICLDMRKPVTAGTATNEQCSDNEPSALLPRKKGSNMKFESNGQATMLQPTNPNLKSVPESPFAKRICTATNEQCSDEERSDLLPRTKGLIMKFESKGQAMMLQPPNPTWKSVPESPFVKRKPEKPPVAKPRTKTLNMTPKLNIGTMMWEPRVPELKNTDVKREPPMRRKPEKPPVEKPRIGTMMWEPRVSELKNTFENREPPVRPKPKKPPVAKPRTKTLNMTPKSNIGTTMWEPRVPESKSTAVKQEPENPIVKRLEKKISITRFQAEYIRSIFGTFGDCKVTYDKGQEMVLVEGTDECLEHRHLEILGELRKIKEGTVPLNIAMAEILSSSWGQKCLKRFDYLIKAKKGKLFFENCTLKILAYGNDNLQSSIETVQAEITGQKHITVPGNISETDFETLKDLTEYKFPVIVSMQNRTLFVQGIKEEMDKAAESIECKLPHFVNIEHTFEIECPQAFCINRIIMDNIPTIFGDVTIIDKDTSKTKMSITLCGKQLHVTDTLNRLNVFISKLHCGSWKLASEFSREEDCMLVANSFSKSKLLRLNIRKFEKKEHCIVSFERTENGTVIIWSEKEQSVDALWSRLKQSIAETCLYMEYFNQSELTEWPQSICENVHCKANKNSVWVEASKHPRTGKAGFLAKGEEHAVGIIIDIIKLEHRCLVESLSKNIATSKAPKRGTLEFVQHAALCTERSPSYWQTNQHKMHTPLVSDRKWQRDIQVFQVDDETKSAISKLVTQDLFNPDLACRGRDAPRSAFTGLEVIDVWRIENPALFDPYDYTRKRLFEECCRRKQICGDIKWIPGSSGGVESTENLPEFMKTELYWEINEHYLFHGTTNVETLCRSGPDPKVGNEEGMFGRGFYLAEMTTKADQYAGAMYFDIFLNYR